MTEPKVELWGYWRSSASWRVRIALRLKGLAYAYHPVHLVRDGGEQYTDAFRAKNPFSQVPTIEIDGVRLTQSLAILDYLDAVAPSPRLFASEPYLRARTWQLAEIVNSGIQPLQNLPVLKRVEEGGMVGKDWAAFWNERGLRALEAEVAGSGGRFLIGDTPTAADCCLVPQLYSARRYGVDVSAFPTLLRVERECERIEAFALAHADRQPDAQPT